MLNIEGLNFEFVIIVFFALGMEEEILLKFLSLDLSRDKNFKRLERQPGSDFLSEKRPTKPDSNLKVQTIEAKCELAK